MPRVNSTLLDIEQSVARPAIFQILNQLAEITQISKDTEILYAGKRSVMRTPGTTIDDTEHKDAKFASNCYTFVEVNETYDVGAMQEIATHSYDNMPIFQDNKLQCSLRPIYTLSDVAISIIYRSTSETEVKRWIADMLIRTSRGRDISLHRISYTYPLPVEYYSLIRDIYLLREAVDGYGDDFAKYLREHATNRMTLLSTRAGTGQIFGVTETQTRIQGLFDFQGVPDAPVFNKEAGAWEISFVYKFSYQRPDAIFAEFPLVVHNQLLPEKYFKAVGKLEDPYAHENYMSRSMDALSLFELDRPVSGYGRMAAPILHIPDYDEFVLPVIPPGSETAFIVLCLLDEDRKNLFNLKEMENYTVSDTIVPYLENERTYMTKLYHSFIHVSLYRNGALQPDGIIEVLPDLTVQATRPLSLRDVYHVRFSLLTEINMVIQPAYTRLTSFPGAFVTILSCLNELLARDPDFIKLRDRRALKDWEFTAINTILTGFPKANNYGPTYTPPYSNYDNISGWIDTKGKEFLKFVTEDELKRYLEDKRPTFLNAMVSGIVAQRKL